MSAGAYLARTLKADRAAILGGRYQHLAADEDQRAQALADLAAAGDRAALTRFAADLARNQRLLAAALGGLQEARIRQSQAQEARNSLSSYDSAGQPAAIVTRPPSVTRRA